MQESVSWWKVWGWRAVVCSCLTNDLNVNNCVKWEGTTAFIWQCTVPMVLAAKLGGSVGRSGLQKLWGYHRGRSENLQHSEQANSVSRCTVPTQKPCIAKHLQEEKPFSQSSTAGCTRHIIVNLLLVPVWFWDALGTLQSSAADLSLCPHSSVLYHPPTSRTTFPPRKHKPQGWGCTAAFSVTQNLGEEPTKRSKSLPLTCMGKCMALHHSNHCLCTSPLKYGISD